MTDKNEMPREIWVSKKEGYLGYSLSIPFPPNDCDIECFSKYHHGSEIQKRDEIIRDLVRVLRKSEEIDNVNWFRAGDREKTKALKGYRFSRRKTLTKHADDLKEICDE